MNKEQRDMLDVLKKHYRVSSDEDVFKKAYDEIVGGSSENARTDYRLFSQGWPFMPPYVRAVYAAQLIKVDV